MEIVTLRFQENVLKQVDRNIPKHNFNSRTEFIREAVRDKISKLNTSDLIREFLKFRGKAKRKLTDEEFRKNRLEVSKELERMLDKRFNLS